MSFLVYTQGEIIDRIDFNLEKTENLTSKG